jgi:integrase
MGATQKSQRPSDLLFIDVSFAFIALSTCRIQWLVQFWCSFDTGILPSRSILNAPNLHHWMHHMATIVKRGNRWRVQIRRQDHTPLSRTFPNKAEAVTWSRDMEHKIDRGQTVDPGRRITFSDILTAYREHVAASKGMSRSKAQALGKIDTILGKRRLIELKTATFIDFCKTRECDGAGPATILQDLSYIGTVLRHGGGLIGAEHATATVITSLDAARRTLRHSGRVAKPEERERRPSEKELTTLISYWSGNPRQSIPMIDLTLFAVATAMRLGEIVNLRWEDLDEATRTITIRARKHPTKKATNHQKVPLPLGTCHVGGQSIDPLSIIRRQPSAWLRKGRIFPHAAQSVSTAFQRATAELEIEDLHFHDLRHDGASRLFEAGWPIERVALVTGHKDWNMLRRYTQLRAEDFHKPETAASTPTIIQLAAE